MILENGPVIVHQGQVRAHIDMEVIRPARMLKVMNDGGKDNGKDFEIRENILSREREGEKRKSY
jgi:hypothetical protein